MAEINDFDYHTVSDESLASMAQDGNREAFSVLTARYVFSVKSRVAHYKDSGIDRDDLVQEGMIGLMSAIRGYNFDCNASFKTFAWLCVDRSIISAIKMIFRKKQVPPSSIVSIDDDNDLLPSCRTDDPETILLAKEDLKASMQKISELLTPFEKKVLNLYLGNCNYDSIAASLNCSVKSVDNALQRLRKKLR